MWRTFGARMTRRSTWVTALIVGTLINLYGHVLVPLLRGSGGPWVELRQMFLEAPGLATFSVVLGYLFPLAVSALSSARAQHEHRSVASLARFPDLKPDPVFRVTPDGDIIEAGARTRATFERLGITRAQQLLGEERWARITGEVLSEGLLRAPETIFLEQEGRWYTVSASSGPDGINVYLAVVPGPTAPLDAPEPRADAPVPPLDPTLGAVPFRDVS